MAAETVIVAAATRPYPGETANGDAWQVDWHAGACRVAVVDGLGHGPEASAAASAARTALAGQPELGPAVALRACHQALRGTRGAAMWVGTVDVAARRLAYAGVGNVDARLWQGGRQQRLGAQRGIVGATLPLVRVFECGLEEGWLLLVCTDGVRAHAVPDTGPEAPCRDLQALVDGLLLAWGQSTDDALVLAARAAEAQRAAGPAAAPAASPTPPEAGATR